MYFKNSIVGIFVLIIFIGLIDCSSVSYDSNCKAKCSAIPIPGQVASSNGCGSYLVTINFSNYDGLSGFNQCCNNHDICYNSCKKTKSDCDFSFSGCLANAVWSSNSSYLTKLKNAGIALTMYTAVNELGCPAYKSAFSRTCQCP